MEISFGEKLKSLRAEHSISRADLAGHLGLGVDAIQSYELGRRIPSLATALQIADFFGASLDYLAGRSSQAGIGDRKAGRDEAVTIMLLKLKADINAQLDAVISAYALQPESASLPD